jgi:hypothetical protein
MRGASAASLDEEHTAIPTNNKSRGRNIPLEMRNLFARRRAITLMTSPNRSSLALGCACGRQVTEESNDEKSIDAVDVEINARILSIVEEFDMRSDVDTLPAKYILSFLHHSFLIFGLLSLGHR